MIIHIAMLQRRGEHIKPEDVGAAVLTQGADETRAELVRLMAEDYTCSRAGWKPVLPQTFAALCGLAWTLEETARSLPA